MSEAQGGSSIVGELTCSIHSGLHAIGLIIPELDRLRTAHGLSADMLTSPDWFLSRTLLWGNAPEVVLVARGASPIGAVLFYRRALPGLPLHVVKGGNRSGDGLVIADPAMQGTVVQAAVAHMLGRFWVQMVLVSLRDGPPSTTTTRTTGADGQRATSSWRTRTVATHLPLDGGIVGVLARMSRKGRRNFRYYRRRAEAELGTMFRPALSGPESAEAVQQLCGRSLYPVPAERAARLEAAIRGTKGAFAMGLAAPDGRWLSYLCGWRQDEGTFVEWQLNDAALGAASLSTVLRACLVEYEAEGAASPKIVFVGGSSAWLGHYCLEHRCSDLVAERQGVRGSIVRKLVTRMRPGSEVALMLRATGQPG